MMTRLDHVRRFVERHPTMASRILAKRSASTEDDLREEKDYWIGLCVDSPGYVAGYLMAELNRKKRSK